MRRQMLCAALLGVALAGCSPALDWREVRPEGSGAQALFPCKPKSQTRKTLLAGAALAMTLDACDVDGTTFALGHVDIGDPARVADALAGLRAALAANLAAKEIRAVAFELPGMTPNPQAVRVWLDGRLPDGTPAQAQAALFVRGTVVYQAAVLGAGLDGAAAGVFFEGLRLP